MPDILPVPPPSGYLAVSGRRAAAAEMIHTACGSVTGGLYAAELLDLLAGVVLRLAGVDDAAARSVLSTLAGTLSVRGLPPAARVGVTPAAATSSGDRHSQMNTPPRVTRYS